jgi:hypothetical protein
MRRLSLLVAVCVGTTVIAASPGGLPASALPRAQAKPIAIPFELANRHIVLKVRVNGSRQLSFVLDTGADAAIVMTNVANQLKLSQTGTVNVGGAGTGTQTGALVQKATWTLDELPGFSQPVAMALPLMQLSPGMGQDIDGIIGTQFIRQFVIGVDYQARTLTIQDPKTFEYHGKGEAIPIEFYRAHPTLMASVTPIGGQPIARRFVLDLGSGMGLALHRPFVNEQNLLGAQAKTIRLIGAAGAGGSVKGQVGRVEALQIGSFRLSQVTTMFAEDEAGAFADPQLAGNIGAQIASRFKVWLDYGRNRIILEPASTFDEPFSPVMSGVAVRAEGDTYRTFKVKEVLENSPATDAGLVEGDVITAINGTSSEQLTLSRILEMFEKPVTYQLEIKRGESDLKVRLTPRKLV